MDETRPAQEQEEQRDRLARRLVAGVCVLLVVVAGFLVHWQALDTTAASFDDKQYISENYVVQHPGWGSAWRFLREVRAPSTVDDYYQPLAMISLMIDCRLGGRADHLQPFRRTSLILHLACAAMAVVLIYVLFDRPWIAGLVGLVHAVHPTAVQMICWTSERGLLLAALLALVGLTYYVRYARDGRRDHYGMALASYVLSLMSYPAALWLPVGLVLLDWWPLQRLSLKALLEKVPFVLAALLFAGIAVISRKTTAGGFTPGAAGGSDLVLMLCYNALLHLYHFAWPIYPSAYHDLAAPLSSLPGVRLTAVIGMCVLPAVLLLSLRWTRGAVTGWLVFFLATLPAAQIIGFRSDTIASDRFAYGASVGLLLALAGFLTWLRTGGAIRRRAGLAVASLVVLGLCGFNAQRAWAYESRFTDTEKLLRYMAERAPGSTVLHYQLGLELMQQKRYAEASAEFEAVLALEPTRGLAHMNLAIIAMEQGKGEEALGRLNEALHFAPNEVEVNYLMGKYLSDGGRLDAAIVYLDKALKIEPEHVETIHTLGLVMYRLQRYPQAIFRFSQVVALKPNHALAHNNWGLALTQQGKYEEAAEQFEQALRIDPGYARAHCNLALALEKQERLDEALNHYVKALELGLSDAELYNNAGVLFARHGDLPRAIACFEKALMIRRYYPEAFKNLKKAKEELAAETQPAGQPATEPAAIGE